MTPQPSISVVIPAYNAADTIDHCLTALADQTFPRKDYEIVVVDDGSSDETCARVAAHSGVQLLTQTHAGPAAARNRGAQCARGDILLFTDADCAPTRGWIERMYAPFEDGQIVGVKGTYVTQQPEIVARFAQLEYEGKYDRMDRHSYIDFIDTYAAAYRRSIFLANEGFDPIFPSASVEDQEFSFRLARQGHKMVFQRDASVSHLAHPETVWAYWRRKFGIGYWKVLVTRRHPDKVWRDSHTPQSLKFQILLVGLQTCFLLGSLFWTPLLWGLALAALLHLLSALPFSLRALKRDLPVALVSPGMHWLRALALGTGFAVGLAAQLVPGGTPERTSGQGSSLRRAARAPLSYGLQIRGWRMLAKRATDVIGAAIGLLISSPVLLTAAIMVKLDSRGPVFFVQERVGESGRIFRIYKLRTMVANAEALLDQLIDIDSLDEPVFKLRDDPRSTRVGRFLRRWSIDEIPQFLNVLKGDMSLVGPRPEEVRIVDHYNDRHRQRLLMKPGITGPVQINGRGDLTLDERVQLETDYTENYSLKRDLQILMRTIPTVIRGLGSY